MNSSTAIAILTAMITPAVLISACGSMILSTSVRLGRVVDRVRALSERFEEISGQPDGDNLTSRSRLLQRCMVAFYLALGAFVAATAAIGLVAVSSSAHYVVLAPAIL